MIRYLNQQEKLKSRELWEEIFSEDSQSFLDFYYTEIIKQNKILAAAEDGRLVSMLHRNPYPVLVKGRQWKVDYIVGVATAPQMRHQGYMRRLLERTLTDLYQEKMGFCFLMPADRRIYQPFDFVYIFDQPQRVLNEVAYRELDISVCGADTSDYQAVSEFLSRQLAGTEVFCKRDQDYVRSLQKEVRSDRGDLLILYRETRELQKEIAGIWAFYGDRETTRELICLPEYMEEAEPPKPAIMARIVDLATFVQVICLCKNIPEDELIILLNVEDHIILENAGYFIWKLDKQTSTLKRTSQEMWEQLSNQYLSLKTGIGELTQWLFGYRRPAWDCAEIVRPLKGVWLDEII